MGAKVLRSRCDGARAGKPARLSDLASSFAANAPACIVERPTRRSLNNSEQELLKSVLARLALGDKDWGGSDVSKLAENRFPLLTFASAAGR